MTEAQHERAIQIKQRFRQIEDLLIFLNELLVENPPAPNGVRAYLKESGFIAHPREIGIFTEDIKRLIDALEQENVRLQIEFENL